MLDPETKKVENLKQYSELVEKPRVDRDTAWNTDKKYEWVMQRTPRHLSVAQFPSMAWESDDIKECSAYNVADEVWKSHLYNIRCAMKGLKNCPPFIIFIIIIFFMIKNDPDTMKVSTEKIDFTTSEVKDEEPKKKTRSFHYWRNNGRSIALSPAVQGFRFVDDACIKRHGITLKCEYLPFVKLDRKVRYLEMDPQLFFTQEPWANLEVEYFKTANRMTAMAIQQKKKEKCSGDPDDQGIIIYN